MKKIQAYAASSIVLLVVAAAGTAGYLRMSSQPAPSAPGPALQKITVANIGMYSVFNLIAKEQGYFEANGLDAQVDEYDSGATSMAALLSGKADFAVAADFVGVTTMFDRPELRILATVSDHDVFRLVTRRDKGITLPKDLKGKKIGVTRHTAGEFYLGRFLAFNDMSINDVEMVDLPPAAMIAQLTDGTLDGILTYEPFAYQVADKLDGSVITWSAQGHQQTLALDYTTQPFIDRHPDLVEGYVRAIADAAQYVHDHDADAKALIAKKLGYDQAYIDYIWPKFAFSVTLDQDLLLTLEDRARWIIQTDPARKSAVVPNYVDAVYFAALEKARPEAVTITHAH